MRPAIPFRQALSALILASMSLAGIGPVHADAIRTWNGASASTTVFDQSASQQGITAAASNAGMNDVTYYSRTNPDVGPLHINVEGTAAASATDQLGQLLSVQTHYYVPRLGTLGYNTGGGQVAASASWTNDAVIVTPPVGGALPDAVRLQFALSFSALDNHDGNGNGSLFNTGVIRVLANNQTLTVTTSRARPLDGLLATPAGFDAMTAAPGHQATGTFHLDLPVNDSGLSDPFQLSLQARPEVVLVSNIGLIVNHSATLALTDVTLLDGTPLKSLGYGVAFESGMAGWPSPVPEPMGFACWGLGALAFSVAYRRRAVCAEGRSVENPSVSR